MSDNTLKKGNFFGLSPLLIFLLVYFIIGICSGSFNNLPLLVGMFFAMAISFIVVKPANGEKLTFNQKVNIFCKGGGNSNLILMVIIYMLAGAFYGVVSGMRATDSVTKIMLSIMPANLVLPGLFLIGCILSFAMGTSMGAISTLLPIGLGLADGMDVSIALVCGIVVGGTISGDNLSFISDTTIAATTTQECTTKDKFKANVLIVVLTIAICCVILSFIPVNVKTINKADIGSFINLLPYICIVILSTTGINVIPAMGISIILGVIIGIIHGDMTLISCLTVIHEGMKSMQDMAIITIIVGGVIAMMKYCGGIDWLLYKISKNTRSKVSGELSIALLVSLADIAVANDTMAIILCGPITKEISNKYDIPSSKSASILNLYSSAVNSIIPYAGQLLISSDLAGISSISIVPYVFYSWLLLIIATIFIMVEFPKMRGSTKR